jgi:hypothetical protein
MKHDSHREILDDLYGATGSGPGCDTVLGMVRAHRASRRRRRTAAAAALVVALATAVFLLRERPSPPRAQPIATTPPMHQIDDEELLDMVDGPAAIATMPDGSKRLLVIVKAPMKNRIARNRGG